MKGNYDMKKNLALIMIVSLVITMFSGCGNNNNNDDNNTQETPSTLVKNTSEDLTPVAAQPTEDEPQNETGTYKAKLEISDEEIAKLTNTRQDSYYGGDRNSSNVPIACLNFNAQYTKYNADFVRYDSESEEKVLYLTFDEGYENGYTSEILDVLKEKNVKAVFFVTMPYVKEDPELIQRMIDEGHIVGNHSTSHPSAGMISYSVEKQKKDLQELHDYIRDNFGGYEMQLFRYPAGIFSEQSLAAVGSMGYTSVFWSFAYADWDPQNQPDAASAMKKLIDRIHPGAIYLLHAVSKTNTEILGQFIDEAQNNGYVFKAYY